MRDEYCEAGYSKFFNQPCLICDKFKHNEEYCNLLLYNPKRYFFFFF